MRYCDGCGSTFRWMRTCPRDGVATRADGADPLVGSVLGERYRVLERIGAGNMGQVYRAAHVRMASVYAVKVLYGDLAHDPTMRGRFEREAEVASLLSSRHIVRVIDFGQAPGGQLYLTMEHLDGLDLRDRIARDGGLDVETAVRIARQIARGLAHAHERGIVHRDLKSDNVMLISEDEEADVVRLLDFGLAQLQSKARLTQAGQVFGTPYYMAPEQFLDAGVDARADLYALGVILYEMLSGNVPFDAESLVALAVKHQTEPPRPLRVAKPGLDVPAPLEAVVMRLLEKQPAARYASARDVLAALRDALAAAPGVSRPPPAPPLAVPSEATHALYQAIVVGAPAYNAGDHARCAQVYRETAETLLRGALAPEERSALGVRLSVAVRRAAACAHATDAAWELRGAFDDVLAVAGTLVAPGAGWLATEVELAGAIAGVRYASSDFELLAEYYDELAAVLIGRVRRAGGPPGADEALEAALARARALPRGPASVAVLGETLQAVGQDRVLPAASLPPPRTSLVSCVRLDETAQRLVHAISVGAPAYNAGDHAGCARVYRSTAESLVAALRPDASCAALSARLQRALDESAGLPPLDAAWVLRHAFDEVLGVSASRTTVP